MKASRLVTGLSLVLTFLASGPARAVVTGQCVQARGGNSCTAGDVTFILVGLGNQTDGCISTSDTLSIYLGGQLQNTSAATRYDVGMYIYNYLGTETNPAASVGYAYNGTSCAREDLAPAGTFNDTRCTYNTPAGSLNLLGGSGPYLNEDNDTCGDLAKVATSTTCDSNADGKWDDSFIIFPDPVTVRCSDGTNGTADGFVDIPTCATWGQNAADIGTGGVCTNENDVLPGTPSKCNCANVNSNIPMPKLALSCSCSPTTVRVGATNGASTACTVTFTNSVTCTPNLSTAERFRCGAASYLQFDTVAGTPNGSFIFGQTQGNAPTETTGGTINTSTAGTIRWTPRDTVATGGGTGLGIIGHNQTGTMSFNYYVSPTVPSGTTINFTTTAYWANDAAFSSRVAQSALTANCSIVTSNVATWSRVTSFGAREEDGRVVVEWETAAEVGTAAFEVERKDPATGEFVRVSETAVPAVAQLPGGRYRLVDATAPRGGVQTWRVTEIDQYGGRETFGPFRVRVRPETGTTARTEKAATESGRDFTARAKDLSPRLAKAAAESKSLPVKAAAKPSARARVEVTRTGMVRLRASEIAAALGMTADETTGQIRAGRLRLSRGGQDVAWQAAGDGDGIVFYGEAIANPYTQVNVYWLERGAGLTMANTAARAAFTGSEGKFADTLHLETDAIPAPTAALPVEDFWIWKSLFPGYPGFDRATLTVQVPAPTTGPATLAVNLYGFASWQRLSVTVNGLSLGEITGGAGAFSVPVPVPAGLLRDGANEIEVTVLEAPRGIWLDSFDLTYEHLYRASGNRLAFQAGAGAAVNLSGFGSADVTVWDLANPLTPKRLTGIPAQPRTDGSWGVYFTTPSAGPFLAATGTALDSATVGPSAPADLKYPGRGAEYVVISPSALRSEAQRLADLRAAQGLSTLVADLGDVMDVFGDGIYDPRAIRTFLSWAVRNWPTPPRYVVLAGKGTYDPRNLMGLSTNLLPAWLITTEDGITTADGEFANLDGSGVPALAVGRIPAVTAAELRAYVDKVAAYERDPGGDWTRSALFVSDDADAGGNFPATNDNLSAVLGGGLALSRVDLGASLQDSRSRLFSALRSGQSLVNYVGHGGLDRITSEGLLLTSDVSSLANGARVPVMTALTCLIAQYAYPSFGSLGEQLVLEPNGGVSALFGPSWLSHNGAAEVLGRSLLPRLAAPGGGRLGDRLVPALAEYAAQGGEPRMLRVYTLLGDPALTSKR